MTYLRDLTHTREQEARAAALVAAAVARDSWLSTDAAETLARKGVSRFFKAGDLLTTADEGVALLPLRTAFLGLVDGASLLGQLDGLVRLPLAGVARLQVGTVAATVVGEGAVTPIARLAFTLSGDPVKVVAQVVLSAEALRALDPGTQQGVTSVLVSAVADATDLELVRVLTAGAPAASSDPGALLAAVSGGRPRRPYLVGGFDALLAQPPHVVRDLQALGVGVVPCAAAAGQLIALDAAGLLVGEDGVRVETARHASVEIDDGTSPSAPAMTSLWQANLACLRAERALKLAVRPGAVAYASLGSPA